MGINGGLEWENRAREGILWDGSGGSSGSGKDWDAQGLFWECSRNALEKLRGSGEAQESLRDYSGIALRMLWGHSGVTQMILRGYSGEAWDAHMDVLMDQKLLQGYSEDTQESQGMLRTLWGYSEGTWDAQEKLGMFTWMFRWIKSYSRVTQRSPRMLRILEGYSEDAQGVF